MEDLPLEIDQSRVLPALLGDKPAIAPSRPVRGRKVEAVDDKPGKKYPPGEVPKEWLAWFEENLDRGVDANELLKVLVAKGFQPARNSRLMQFVAAHESLTVTSVLPVMKPTGEVVNVPATSTIIGSLTDSAQLPPQWTAWLRDNLNMGVDRGVLFEILVKHGFEPAKNPILVQALTQPNQNPSHMPRREHRELMAREKVCVACDPDFLITSAPTFQHYRSDALNRRNKPRRRKNRRSLRQRRAARWTSPAV